MGSVNSFTTENILVLDFNNRMPAGYVNIDKIRYHVVNILNNDKIPKRKKKSTIALFLEREVHGIKDLSLTPEFLYFSTTIDKNLNGYTIFLKN